MKFIAAFLVVFLATPAYAGFLKDLIGHTANAYGQQAEEERGADANFQRENDLADKNLERHKVLMLKHHELEMQRINREYELKSHALTSPQADSVEQLEVLHPGWVRLVRSNRFSAWMAQQPPSVQQLKDSDRLADAALMIDLFKRDQKR